MTPRPASADPKTTVITLRISLTQLEALRAIQERDGAPISEQVRRGIQLWLEAKGVSEAAPRRAATRRKA